MLIGNTFVEVQEYQIEIYLIHQSNRKKIITARKEFPISWIMNYEGKKLVNNNGLHFRFILINVICSFN